MKSNLLRIVFLLLTFLISETTTAATYDVKASDLDARSLSLLISAQEGNIEKIRNLICEGIPLNVKDDYGRIPLHITAYTGQLEFAQLAER